MKRAYPSGISEYQRIVHVLVEELAQDSGIIFAYLYGSFPELRPYHDIDIGVYVRDPRDAEEIALALTQNLSSALERPADVRILNNAPTSFLYHVLRGERLLCRDDELLSSLIERTARIYLDIEPLRRQAIREAFVK